MQSSSVKRKARSFCMMKEKNIPPPIELVSDPAREIRYSATWAKVDQY